VADGNFIVPQRMVRVLVSVAEREGIPCQIKLPPSGGTDAGPPRRSSRQIISYRSTTFRVNANLQRRDINLPRHFDLPVSMVKQVTVFLRFPDPDAAIFIPFLVYSILRTIFPRTRPPSSAAKAWKAS
jgi:hypothetical protein